MKEDIIVKGPLSSKSNLEKIIKMRENIRENQKDTELENGIECNHQSGEVSNSTCTIISEDGTESVFDKFVTVGFVEGQLAIIVNGDLVQLALAGRYLQEFFNTLYSKLPEMDKLLLQKKVLLSDIIMKKESAEK